MFTFFTTTTGAWDFTIKDETGEILPVNGATFVVWFVNVSNNLKVQGAGEFEVTDGPNGEFRYSLGDTDLADAYATHSPAPGKALFDVCVEITISGEKSSPMQPPRIYIRKI